MISAALTRTLDSEGLDITGYQTALPAIASMTNARAAMGTFDVRASEGMLRVMVSGEMISYDDCSAA